MLKLGLPLRVEQPLLDGVGLDALERFHAGVLRRHAAAHRLDDQERRQVVEIRLAASGGAGGADLVVDVEPGAEDRRVAGAAGDLPGQAARGRDAADVAVRADAVAVDRAPEAAFGGSARRAPSSSPASSARDSPSRLVPDPSRVRHRLARRRPSDRASARDRRGASTRSHSWREFSVLRSSSILKPIARANCLRARRRPAGDGRCSPSPPSRPATACARPRCTPPRRRASSARACTTRRARRRRRRWAARRSRCRSRADRARGC